MTMHSSHRRLRKFVVENHVQDHLIFFRLCTVPQSGSTCSDNVFIRDSGVELQWGGSFTSSVHHWLLGYSPRCAARPCCKWVQRKSSSFSNSKSNTDDWHCYSHSDMWVTLHSSTFRCVKCVGDRPSEEVCDHSRSAGGPWVYSLSERSH